MHACSRVLSAARCTTYHATRALAGSDGSSRGGKAGAAADDAGWRTRLGGWLGGDAGLPVDGWLTTCCSQVCARLAARCGSTQHDARMQLSPPSAPMPAGPLAPCMQCFRCCATHIQPVQIGQIMLTLPNAYSKVGLLAALPLSISCACFSFWTMWCLIALYAERKHRLVRAPGRAAAAAAGRPLLLAGCSTRIELWRLTLLLELRLIQHPPPLLLLPLHARVRARSRRAAGTGWRARRTA